MLVLTFVQLSNLLQDMLLELIDSLGFQGQYVARLKSLHNFVVFHDAKSLKLDVCKWIQDFLYLPIDFQTQACLGYAFVNMVDSGGNLEDAKCYVCFLVGFFSPDFHLENARYCACILASFRWLQQLELAQSKGAKLILPEKNFKHLNYSNKLYLFLCIGKSPQICRAQKRPMIILCQE